MNTFLRIIIVLLSTPKLLAQELGGAPTNSGNQSEMVIDLHGREVLRSKVSNGETYQQLEPYQKTVEKIVSVKLDSQSEGGVCSTCFDPFQTGNRIAAQISNIAGPIVGKIESEKWANRFQNADHRIDIAALSEKLKDREVGESSDQKKTVLYRNAEMFTAKYMPWAGRRANLIDLLVLGAGVGLTFSQGSDESGRSTDVGGLRISERAVDALLVAIIEETARFARKKSHEREDTKYKYYSGVTSDLHNDGLREILGRAVLAAGVGALVYDVGRGSSHGLSYRTRPKLTKRGVGFEFEVTEKLARGGCQTRRSGLSRVEDCVQFASGR